MTSSALDATAHPAPETPSQAACARRSLGQDARRAITAILRERAHRLPRTLAPRMVAAARLLPVLLHASFAQRPLDDEAPGVVGLRYRRRWSTLARAFGLPPPCRAQRGRCLVDAVVVVPGAGELHALVLASGGLSADERAALEERLAAIQPIFAAAGVPVRATTFEPGRLGRDGEACHRMMAFGALAAGRLSPADWDVLEASRKPLVAQAASALAASAPTPLARLALTLMTRAPCPGPLDAAVALLADGVAPRQLADPELFAVRWAGLVPGLREPLEQAALLSRDAPGGDLAHLIQHGLRLACASAAAIRASGLARIDRYTRRLWSEALGPGMPRVLLPALGARLAEEAAAGRLRLDPVRVGRSYEVRLACGARLGRGASPVQARVRALGLVAAAGAARSRGDGPTALLAGLDATWRAVAQRLSRPRERAALVLMPVAGGGARPGPPVDLLNRGPERALEFDGALAVLLVPGRRPSGRMLGPEEAVHTVLRRAPAGAALEMLAAQGAARPVAARLAQISTLLSDPSVTGPIAVEAGGRVLVPQETGCRSYPLRRFAARPRVFTPDPDAPDISITSGERRGARSRPPGIVQCRVVLATAHAAALLYCDESGAHLREEAPLSELEERLRDASEIVRAAIPSAVLAVRLSDDLELAVRRAGPPGPRFGVAVRGELPFIAVEIEGERFGGTSPLGWSAAAEALLARWPAGSEGTVGVNTVTATARGARLPPLLALYASSVGRRRLRAHLGRTLASYRTAATGRKEA